MERWLVCQVVVREFYSLALAKASPRMFCHRKFY